MTRCRRSVEANFGCLGLWPPRDVAVVVAGTEENPGQGVKPEAFGPGIRPLLRHGAGLGNQPAKGLNGGRPEVRLRVAEADHYANVLLREQRT